MRTPARSSDAVPRLRGYLPEHPARTYPPVGKCIYCGRTEGLSDEHIVPLGLGGRFVLPKASCAVCADFTSKFERTCLRTMYGPLRLLYDLPSRRTGDRPAQLELKVKFGENEDWKRVPVDQERYPFLVTFPHFGLPGVLSGADPVLASGPVTQRLWIRGASPSYDFHELLQELATELGTHTIMPESKVEVPAFCRLLAKVAYSFAVAERGLNAVDSPIVAYATNGDLSHCLHYIGSGESDKLPSDALHELSIIEFGARPFLVAEIRLLAKLGTPTYYVVLSEKNRDRFIFPTP